MLSFKLLVYTDQVIRNIPTRIDIIRQMTESLQRQQEKKKRIQVVSLAQIVSQINRANRSLQIAMNHKSKFSEDEFAIIEDSYFELLVQLTCPETLLRNTLAGRREEILLSPLLESLKISSQL